MDNGEVTDATKTERAIEGAFEALVKSAQEQGLAVVKPMGLMYLPTQSLTENFQAACRAVLASLRVTG